MLRHCERVTPSLTPISLALAPPAPPGINGAVRAALTIAALGAAVAVVGGRARTGGREDLHLRAAARDRRSREPGRARASHPARRLGQPASERAGRAELRGRAAPAAAAALRPRARQAAADRVGRLLRAVRAAARCPRRRLGRAARGRRQPGDRRARRRPAVDGLRRRQGPRALRLVSRAPRGRAPRLRLPADHDDDLYRCVARALPAGVVRGADVRDGLARQLHPARHRRAARLGEGRPAAAEAVGAAAAPRARLQPRRHGQAVGADVPDQARHEADGLSRLDQLPGAAHSRRRRRPLRARAPRRRRVLERAAAGGHADHGPGAARQRRRTATC